MKRTITVILLTLAITLTTTTSTEQVQENGQIIVELIRKVRIRLNVTDLIENTVPQNLTRIKADQLVEGNEGEGEAEEEASETEKPDTIHRIVGGQQVSISRVPWQAAVIQNATFVCGASVISTIWVLTAAHCVYGYGNSNFAVRAGSDSFRFGGQVRRIGFTAVHGQYSRNSHEYDIAMLRTTRRFTFGPNLQPVRVPSANSRLPRLFVVTGWGSISASGSNPTRHLRGVVINLSDFQTCMKNYADTQYKITENMFCASAPGRDSCQGDSGGGVVNGGIIYGIVSYGVGCADPIYPGVNTNIPKLSSWILNVAKLFSRRRSLNFDDQQTERGMKIVLV